MPNSGKKFAWFILFWLVGVLSVGSVALIIRWILK